MATQVTNTPETRKAFDFCRFAPAGHEEAHAQTATDARLPVATATKARDCRRDPADYPPQPAAVLQGEKDCHEEQDSCCTAHPIGIKIAMYMRRSTFVLK